MTDITWPAELPELIILNGLVAKKNSNVIRTSMDAGPQKTRRRYTVQTKNFDGYIVITESQREVLEDWFDNTIGSGSLRFKMKNPQTLQVEEFRFREDYSEESSDGLWKIVLPLERMDA